MSPRHSEGALVSSYKPRNGEAQHKAVMNPPVSKRLSPWAMELLSSRLRIKGEIMNLTRSLQSDEQAGQAVPVRAERQSRDSRDGPASQSPSEGRHSPGLPLSHGGGGEGSFFLHQEALPRGCRWWVLQS